MNFNCVSAKRTALLTAVTLSVAIGAAESAHADSISFYLNQTNVESVLPDGANYALVTINDNVANSLQFSVSLLAPLTSIAGSNFGIDNFAFNVVGANPLQDAGNIPGQWTLPAGWGANVAPPPNQSDGFGRFDAAVDAGGNARVTTLTFSLNNTSLNLYSFLENSTQNAGQGNVYFSAHIAGFNGSPQITSGYFGGSTQVAVVPLPPALPLLLWSLTGLGFFTRRR